MRTPVPPHSGAALTCLRPLHRATGRSSAPPDLRPPCTRRASLVGAARVPDASGLRRAPDPGLAPPATAVDEASDENPRSHRPPQSTKSPAKTLEATGHRSRRSLRRKPSKPPPRFRRAPPALDQAASLPRRPPPCVVQPAA
ncbi:Uncharacterized protein M6B38_236965 [Iris pallida]|uniref:Uncharacterized protein n=1 Tax=Iris pallida TaxID=29817 RepID=A0AAX6DLS3_IRIPA|nr:Uncharacterized protein M6B38_236965 [Iris pallida]